VQSQGWRTAKTDSTFSGVSKPARTRIPKVIRITGGHLQVGESLSRMRDFPALFSSNWQTLLDYARVHSADVIAA